MGGKKIRGSMARETGILLAKGRRVAGHPRTTGEGNEVPVVKSTFDWQGKKRVGALGPPNPEKMKEWGGEKKVGKGQKGKPSTSKD